MTYFVVVEKGENSYGADVPDLPGCAVVADIREEVLKLIREAAALHLEALRQEGSPIPEPATTTDCVQV